VEENPLWGGLVFVDEQYVTEREREREREVLRKRRRKEDKELE
jgi:hypothetical protein